MLFEITLVKIIIIIIIKLIIEKKIISNDWFTSCDM